ncbi:hypothetical protein B7494_g6707 [Chlorociboria aeruginascens]|nr:hypothetical protein B7494_g6707 [Chlorociboria aeruginascens]
MDEPSNSKRRRGLGVVTPNACTECRKKRCDGQNPCGRCVSQKVVECIYEIPVRQSKEHMRAAIEQMKAHQQATDAVISALISTDQTNQVLDQLRRGESLETISEKLKASSHIGENITSYARASDYHAIENALLSARGIGNSSFSMLNINDPHIPSPHGQDPMWNPWHGVNDSSLHLTGMNDDSMSWTSGSASNPQSAISFPLLSTTHEESANFSASDGSIQFARDQGREAILGQKFGVEERPDFHNADKKLSWTTVTNDEAFIEHLMTLYFCWEYPIFASLSKEHFLEAFKTGDETYCSSLLVNAMLSLGCRFSTQPESRTDPNNSNTAGDHFFGEALRLLKEMDDCHTMTTIQALSLMSLREASCGRSSDSIFLSGQSIRLAIEMGLHKNAAQMPIEMDDEDDVVRAATFWGAFSLDQAWSLSIGRLPHSSRHIKLMTKPAVIGHIEASSWVPYTDDGAPLERPYTQPSNIRTVFKTFCELSKIVHISLYALYSPGANLTSESLLEIYTQYLRWYEAIPAALRLGHNFTPAVLFSHMYYHFAILLLFRPFIKLELVGSGVSPRDVCKQTADAISTLVKSYSELYSLKRTPSFVPYFVLASGINHLVVHGNTSSGPEMLYGALADLKEMESCHGFATRARHILHFLVNHWHINVSFDESEDDEDLEILCRPSPASLNLFCPNIESSDLENIIRPSLEGGNPLFWPFPLQGRPLLTSTNLESAGFSLLL